MHKVFGALLSLRVENLYRGYMAFLVQILPSRQCLGDTLIVFVMAFLVQDLRSGSVFDTEEVPQSYTMAATKAAELS